MNLVKYFGIYISTMKNFYGTSMQYLRLFQIWWGDMASLIFECGNDSIASLFQART